MALPYYVEEKSKFDEHCWTHGEKKHFTDVWHFKFFISFQISIRSEDLPG